VLLGNGDGTFGLKTDIGAGIGPITVAIADLDLDGRADLAVAGIDKDGGVSTTSVLLGNGDGTFWAKQELDMGGNELYSVAIADLDADGRPDLAVAKGGAVSVMLGHGDGTFAAGADLSVGSRPRSVAISDLNADGRPDLAAANEYPNAISVMVGNGDGTFGAKADFGAGIAPSSVAIADLDADGRPDLVAANSGSNTVSVLRSASGSPTPILVSLASAEAMPDRVVLRWQGDGVANIAARVHRRQSAGEWEELGSPVAEAADVLRYEDRAVTPGARYAYRLGYREGATEYFTSEFEVAVPLALRFALEGFRPNPAIGALVIAFTLADDSPATIEVIDVSGRRVLRHEMRGLGPGRHVIPVAGARGLAAGVYMVTLHHAGETRHTRGVVVR
jgi:hypothetical protein